MNTELATLVALQNVDRQLHELDVSSRQLPARVAELEGAVAAARKTVSDLESKQIQAQRERTALVAAAKEAEEKLKHSQERLVSISTNREYDAVHAEIASHQQAKQSAISRLQALEEELRKLSAAIEAAHGNAIKVEQEYGPQIAELRQKMATVDTQRQELLTRRQQTAAAVPPAMLRVYERIHRCRKGADVLSFVGPQRRSCAHCHMVLQPQLLNDVRAGTKLATCQNCGSILLWQDPAATPVPGAA